MGPLIATQRADGGSGAGGTAVRAGSSGAAGQQWCGGAAVVPVGGRAEAVGGMGWDSGADEGLAWSGGRDRG
jgi:hypothetical protein